MAPAPDDTSSPGTATYSSDTLHVDDGTWDFSKNTFLLPNLVGLNFETMRINGMASRFSSVTQYHKLVLAHGLLAAAIFCFIIPFSVLNVRFSQGRIGRSRGVHARANVFAGLLLIAVFVLGYFAVGPERSLTNPHHGIGVAVFLLFILQMFGGRLVYRIEKFRSFRLMLHQWSGRAIALLGIVQVPLGLTLYGSPLYIFILFTVWMSFLVLLYFILEYKRQGRDRYHGGGGRSEAHTQYTSDYPATTVGPSEHGGGKKKWLAPLIAGAGIWAMLHKKKDKNRGVSRERSRSPGTGRSYSRSRGPDFAQSHGGGTSYFDDDKYYEEDKKKGGGFMTKLLGVGAALGAARFVKNKTRNNRDEEYSAVSTETPRRQPPRGAYTVSDLSEISDQYRRDPRGPPTMAAQAMSAASGPGPSRPPPGHSRAYSRHSIDDDDSYESPSRRPRDTKAGGGVAKGLLAGLGAGWLMSKFKKKKDPRDDESSYYRDDDDFRSGLTSRYTGDGYFSPSRNGRRYSQPPSRQPTAGRRTDPHLPTDGSSIVEPRLGGGTGPPMPPLTGSYAGGGANRPPTAGGAPPVPVPVPGGGAPSIPHSGSRIDNIEPAQMPPMPPDPRDSDDRLHRSDSSRRRRAGDEAAAAALASASQLAAEEESRHNRRRDRDRDRTPSRPPRTTTVKMTVHDDRVNLRRLTEEEAAMSRRDQGRRRRGDSMSSLSGNETPSHGRYRRDSSQKRAESAAERTVEGSSHLSPPNPAFASSAGGRRPKDSAYYSGQPTGGPSTLTPPQTGQPLSSLGSDSHGTWSGMSPSPGDKPAGSAAENRRRRRLERRRSVSRPIGADMFD